jgi:hypothetical protein
MLRRRESSADYRYVSSLVDSLPPCFVVNRCSGTIVVLVSGCFNTYCSSSQADALRLLSLFGACFATTVVLFGGCLVIVSCFVLGSLP